MCSIPGLPTPGSEVTIEIRRVNPNSKCGLVELWVNIDVSRKHAYEQMKKQIQLPERKFCGSEGKTGDLCLVCSSSMWHRARIVSMQNDTCEVFLIDQGRSCVSTWDALAWGQSDSFFLPPELEFCILANVTSLKKKWSKEADRFLSSLPEKTLNGVVQHVLMPHRTVLLDIPFVSKHMCTLGAMRKLPADEFKGVVLECLTLPVTFRQVTKDQSVGVHLDDRYVQPELLCGIYETVRVTEVTDPHNIFCNLQIYSKALETLSDEIQRFYEESSDSGGQRPQTRGEPCAARGSNGTWYRSLLKQSIGTDDQLVEVTHVDVGKTELVPVGCIRHVRREFLKMPVVTYHFSLHGLDRNGSGWTAKRNECLKSELLNKTFVAKLENHFQETYSVTLYAGNVASCVSKRPLVAVDIETASRGARGPSPLVPADAYNYSAFDMESGTEEEAWITSSETVHRFFCQLKRNSHLFDKVKADVQQIVGRSRCSSDPVGPDGLCLVRYDDGEWHRGKVVQTSPDLEVLFVDYGDTLAVNPSDVQPFPAGASAAKSVPALAVRLGLFGVPADVPREVDRWFANRATGATVTVSVVAKGDGGKLLVELFEGLLNVNVIVREKAAQAKRVGTGPDRRADQELASERVNPTREDSSPEELACMSKRPLETSPYGAAEPGQDCDETALEEESKRSNAAAEVSTKDIHPDDAVVPPPEKSCAYRPPIIRRHTSQEMYASCIAGPGYFWCQFARTENLDAVSRLTQSVGETLKDAEVPEYLGPGSPCLALFSADSRWHRAQVLRRSDGAVRVLFVDYGNECEVDVKDVRCLPSCLMEHAPQAFLCSLDGFDESKGSWDDRVYDDFYNLLVDKLLSVTVLRAREHSEIGLLEHTVKIQSAGRDLNEAVQRYWKAISAEIPTAGPPQPSSPSAQSDRSRLEEGVNAFSYERPNIPLNKTEEVYASCIVEPRFFWCQFANAEVLGNVARLAQEAGQAAPDPWSASAFGPGGPCLALFSADNRWYRALILSREEDQVHVVFVDYGNESDVDVKDVRRLPAILQEWTPRAFLCSLSGFDQSEGTWENEVYDHFYDLLVDKPLRVAVCRIVEHSDVMLPQHVVEIESEGVSVNAAMQKYWKPTTQ